MVRPSTNSRAVLIRTPLGRPVVPDVNISDRTDSIVIFSWRLLGTGVVFDSEAKNEGL